MARRNLSATLYIEYLWIDNKLLSQQHNSRDKKTNIQQVGLYTHDEAVTRKMSLYSNKLIIKPSQTVFYNAFWQGNLINALNHQRRKKRFLGWWADIYI